MATIEVAVVNCSGLTHPEFTSGVEVLQRQLDVHVRPRWGTDATLTPVDGIGIKPTLEPGGNSAAWALVVLDTMSAAAVYHGYRDLTRWGLPLGRAVIDPVLDHPRGWTLPVSHALLELLTNPNDAAVVSVSCASRRLVAKRVCDPVEKDGYSIVHASGTEYLVSNFVLPSWFDSTGARPFDQMQLLDNPQEISPNGGRSRYFGSTGAQGACHWTLEERHPGAATIVTQLVPPAAVPLVAAAPSSATEPPVFEPSDFFLPP